MAGWIGVDLDGTLAHFDRWRGPRHIGLPIPAMAKRVHDWHSRGVEVRIFTARASRPELIPDVQKWLERHGFPPLAITNEKDFGMVELWDDRAIQVLYNTGKAVRPSRLQEVEKAELFDPDEAAVYVDDENRELTPSEEEVARFKRNIEASSAQDLNSLDELLDALDDGDYAPGSSEELSDSAPEPEPDATASQTIAPAISAPPPDVLDEVPLASSGFVAETSSTDDARPKGVLVEIDLGAEDFDHPELNDTAEFPTLSDDNGDIGDIREEADEDVQAAAEAAESIAETTSDQHTMDTTLEEQPLGDEADFGDLDNEIEQAARLDTSAEELGPHDALDTSSTHADDTPFNRIPRLTAFPEDELDDIDDLPSLRIDRR